MIRKVLLITILILIIPAISFAGSKAVRIDKFEAIDKIGPQDYHLETLRIDDPENPFVSIYITHIIQDYSMSDPSNVSIACRLTGPIPTESGKQIINKTTNHDIGHFRKSMGTKVMKISRAYDREKNVLIYNVYTTKLFDGSMKHSLSVVPLGIPLTP